MLPVETLGGHHEPACVRSVRKQLTRRECVWTFAFKKGQGKQGHRAIEEKQKTVAFNDWKTLESRKGRNVRLAGDVLTTTIATEPPLVERALNGFAHDLAAAEIRSEVRTACVEHGDFPAGGTKCYQVAP